MSWGEVYKINSNMNRAINEQLRDMMFRPLRIITTTGTYTPEKTGLYQVICVGSGGDGNVWDSGNHYSAGGGGGGVAIKTIRLESTTSYNVTVSTTASFGNILSATSGAGGSTPTGGTASGGDYNFTGETGAKGSLKNDVYTVSRGGSVGVVISGLSRQISYTTTSGTFHIYGEGILQYGGGGAATGSYNSGEDKWVEDAGQPAAVIIIPLEMEE